LEDTYQFTKRMLIETYKETGKREWTYEEIIRGFHEWYGIDVGETYYKRALEILVEKNIIDFDPEKKTYRLKTT
ncbi:MAG: phosphoribosyltransferase, partial [Desulfurococcaceae archaeon]